MSFKRLESGLLVPEFNIAVPKILPGGHNLNQMLQARAPRRRFLPLATKQAYLEKVLATESGDLIACWPENESAGATADNAEGTAARDGTITGGSLGEPGIGDGGTSWGVGENSTDQIDVFSASLNTAIGANPAGLTLMIWGLADSWVGNEWRSLFNIGDDARSQSYLAIEQMNTSNTMRAILFFNSSFKAVSTGGHSDAGFVCWALTYNDSTNIGKFYKDGVQEGADITSVGAYQGTIESTSCTIGTQHTSSTQSWNGDTAFATIWTTDLSAAQLLELATV